MSSSDFETVVIGSGFAGMSVAHALGGSGVAVIDRGEPFDLAAASARIDAGIRDGLPPAYLGPLIDLEARVLASALPDNGARLPLSRLTGNVMTFVQGGISNWWGGYAARITEETFRKSGTVSWPFGLDEIAPFYERAEHLLRVHGDPGAADHRVFAALPGWDHWRDYMAPMFPQARVTPQAKNVTDRDAAPRGLCLGNGHCKVCSHDAKARPANVFPLVDVIGRSRVDRIVFEGSQAVAIEGTTDGEAFELSFDRLVVAAGGVENVALLNRSKLPAATPAARVGSLYQDHTASEIIGVLPEPVDHFRLGAEGGVEIPELSGYIEGIEVKTVMVPTGLTREHVAKVVDGFGSPAAALAGLPRMLGRVAPFFLQMEVPPEWNLRLRTRGHEGYVHSMPYLRNVPVLDAVVLEVARRMGAAGIQVAGVLPQHRWGYGGHHYSGTTPMSADGNGVVDSNLRLVGTDNVYVNGGSVIPRCGGSGPTLTIVALGLRLGEHLARS